MGIARLPTSAVMQRNFRRLLVLLMMFQLSACADEGPGEVSASVRAAVLTLGDNSDLNAAVERLFTECMHQRGYAVPISDVPTIGRPTHLTGVLGLLDSETAQEFGYGVLLVEEKGAQDPLTRFAEWVLRRSSKDSLREHTGFPQVEQSSRGVNPNRH